MRILTALAIAVVVTVACAPTARAPRILDPAFTPGEIGEVALAPVVFADEPLDRYLGAVMAHRIQRDAAQALQEKGYEVLMLDPPHGLRLPKAPPEGDLVAPAMPSGADAVMLIRIDHFLDTGLYERKSRIPVEIYATAALMMGDDVLWSDEGMGHATAFSSGYDSLEILQISARLVESLFTTLPSRTR